MIYSLLNDISWVVNIRTPYLTPIFEFFTWLGYRDFLFMFIPFIYWCYDRKVFGKLLVIVFFSAIINSFLKDIFQDGWSPLSLKFYPMLLRQYLLLSFTFPTNCSLLFIDITIALMFLSNLLILALNLRVQCFMNASG